MSGTAEPRYSQTAKCCTLHAYRRPFVRMRNRAKGHAPKPIGDRLFVSNRVPLGTLFETIMGTREVESLTSAMSTLRSNQLSYAPAMTNLT